MLDRIATLSDRRFFSGGWGPRPELDRYLRLLAEPPPTDQVSIHWKQRLRIADGWQRDGTFDSPHAHLPQEARRARLRLVVPAPTPLRVCILFAATNDDGYVSRSRLARRLVAGGTAVAMLENPFYGSRRVKRSAPLTVYDALVMGRAAVEEGLALVTVLGGDFRIVGVSGYSMGGSVASLVSAASPAVVATAALGASHSPGPVFTEGVLSSAVDWQKLGGTEARGELADVLGRASTLLVEPAPHSSAAIIALARRDAYIPPHSVIDLHRHWPGSELRWLSGGHARLHLSTRAQARVIADSFTRLDASRVSPRSG